MTTTPGSRLGAYEIVGPLGAGGMGEVLRARDTKLNREVALKILPEAFAADPERLARFKREAQVLAALNHPNIAAIYGFEDASPSGSGQAAVHALVLELVDGPTLADRIAPGPMPIDEVLPIARQIAEALEAAHEQGIVHRDLKPANIKVKDDGTVKVLDFGLAKALEPTSAAMSADVAAAPTITTPAMTGVGVILGTAAYMSPEQAKGRPADKRSDVWAFGCVLYEMLTGRRAFEGDDVSDTLAAVLRSEPDWNALPATTPSSVRRILKACLEKDRRGRIPQIAVARFLLDEPAQPSAVASPGSRRPLLAAAALVVVVSAIAVGAWLFKPRLVAPTARPVRFTLAATGPRPLGTANPYRDVAMSWDGSRLVYSAYAGPTDTQLIIRNLDRLDVTPVAAQPAAAPFESPDGRWIGYVAVGTGELKKVAVAGGPPVSLCRLTGYLRGASWGPGNSIVFATSDSKTGLLSVSGDGGEPTVLTTPNANAGELDHVFPTVLPSGNAVLFTITTGRSVDDNQVAVLDLKTRRYKTLIRAARQAEYVRNGYLVYGTGLSLRAVRFDPQRLETAGEPVPLVDDVLTKSVGGMMDFSVSPAGALAYVSGRFATTGLSGNPHSLVWVDRHGREQAINAPPRSYVYARLSPDGSRIALDIRDQEQDIWTYDIARETLTRLTTSPAPDSSPLWTPDGRRVVYTESINGPSNLFWQPADGSGSAERLTTSPVNQTPTSVFSRDGSRVVFSERGAQTGIDLMTLRLDGKSRPELLLRTQFNEQNGDVSSDGRWLLYQSNESGQVEVYVRPFPDVAGERIQVSNAGGEQPMWARNGKEIFYVDANGFLTSVAVQTAPAFSAGRRKKVFETKYFSGGPGTSGRTYDVTRDGQRFLMIKEPTEAPSAPAASLVVVLNLAEELRARLVPTK